ncbi:cyanophycinase [Segetibacter aerophilus]|uniref:Cyanophycinase n=1 Tax=Segetibacter aerophilus TaxID=670293 RepID=A0A512BD23_9BACT|nr:cyanophycinase [Segetibacter aerophilus]GEO09861.1 cyanophycinase [Segetibacter aerophilus]
MSEKGKLIAIGGAEDKGTVLEKALAIHHNLNFFGLGILRRIVHEAGGILARIEVVTTASMIPFEVGNNYLEAFGRIGCTNVDVMHIRNREDAQDQDYIDRIQECDAVMFTGGNQMRLTSTFGGTKFLRIIQNRYKNEPFVVAGTSAGAMAMSNTMIYEGDASKAHLKGEVKITTGLGFMQNVIFDSHFEKRGRFGRLSQAVGANPSCIGIGLGEDTGMLITEGNKMEAIGSGMVVIIDGHDIRHSNIADIPEGNPMSVENIRVHLCAKGNGFLVHERKFVEKMAKDTTPIMQDWD